jgi:ribosomal protein S27AE
MNATLITDHRECPSCKDVTPHQSVTPEKREGLGPKKEEWICTRCGHRSGPH